MSEITRGSQTPSEGMLARLEALAQQSSIDSARWAPNRLILQNYWLYSYQEFHFADGKLVLRGQNGAGKSTVLTTAVTLALDGDKTPVRMDTFGTNTKAISDYLIGPKDLDPKDPLFSQDRTAYVALEFRLGASQRYKTIGLSVRAERRTSTGQPKLTSWYFVIGDGRRCGRDHAVTFSRLDGNGEIMRSLGEMEEILLGDGNFIGSKQSEYQHEVNRELFGFPTVDGFRYMIQVLLTLRSPKLGKGLKPAEACDMLSNSLPPLDPSLLEKITRLMDDIDATQKRLQETDRQRTLMAGVEREQSALARASAQLRAVEYQQAVAARQGTAEQAKARLAQVRVARDEIQVCSARLRELDEEAADLRGTLKILRNHEAYREQENLRRAAVSRDEAHETTERDTDVRDKQIRAEKLAEDSLKMASTEWAAGKDRLIRTAGELREVVEAARWPVALADVDRLIERAKALEPASTQIDVRTAHLTEDARSRKDSLRVLKNALDARAASEQDDARARQRTEDRAEALSEAETRQGIAAAAAQQRRQQAGQAVRDWHATLAEARVGADAVARILGRIAGYTDPDSEPRMLLGPVQAVLAEQRREVGGERDRARDTLGRARDRLTQATARLEEWREGDHRNVPEPRPGQQALREQLAVMQIPAVPLYAAAEFRPEVDSVAAAAIESALADAGLLDAMIIEAGDQAHVRQIAGEEDDARADRWIAAAPVEGMTLADLLQPSECTIQTSTIEAALRTIALDGQGPVALDLAGGWRLGALEGAALRRNAARYIGETNRRRAWETELLAREAEVANAQNAANVGEAHVDELDGRLAALDAEEQSLRELPSLGLLQNALRDWKIRESYTAAAQIQLVEAVQVAERAKQRLVAARHAVDAASRPVPEARGLDASGVLDVIRRIDEALRSHRGLQAAAQEIHFSSKRLQHCRTTLTEAREARAAAERRLGESELRLRQLEGEHRTIEATLKAAGLDEILERERRAEHRMEKEIPEERETLADRRGTLRETVAQGEVAVTLLEEQAKMNAADVERAESAFGTALRSYPTLADDLGRFENDSAVEAAEDLLRDRRGDDPETLWERVDRTVKERSNGLVKALYDEDPGHELDIFRPDIRHEEGKFQLVAFRNVETATGPLTPAALLEVLEREHKLNQSLVREKEDELYEAFLYGEVATEVRKAIHDAAEANKHVNALLEDTPISDRKMIELTWEPFKGQREKGGPVLDFGPIVELLRRSPASLRPEQLQKIKDFFGGHIAEVRRREQDGTSTTSFAEALHEVLDYRTWFRYVIRLREGESPPVDLTAGRHGKLSGAEQALSVFIPLLAAADARYRDAHAMAPKILAMDEAFSGVDATNTAAVWAFMAKLRFSWIMSSEKLWGVGSSLSACSTYQFVKRGSVAAVSHWLWDGTSRVQDGMQPEAAAASSGGQAGLFETAEGAA